MEHPVSCLSAKTIFEHLDRQRYRVLAIGWHRQGGFLVSDNIQDLIDRPGDPNLGCVRRHGPPRELSDLGLNAVFPIVHGTFGEDGVLQGHLDLLGIPYAGSGVLGSSLCMHKGLSKAILKDAGIPVTDWLTIRQGDLLPTTLPFDGRPCFVKPASSGSSVGVTKVLHAKDLPKALETAFRECPEVLVEPAVNARELECAFMNGEASGIGEIVCHHDFYSYEAKYIDPKGADTLTHPILQSGIEETLRTMAIKAAKACQVRDFARVDFFMDRDNGRIYLNEINTHPGFTSISMFPKLWEAQGVPIRQQLDRILARALASAGPPG